MIILTQPLALDVPPGINHEFSRIEAQQADDGARSEWVLMASFSGAYPLAAKGEGHGRFVAAATMQAIVMFEPFGLILDFRELVFDWGRELLQVYDDVRRFKETETEPPDPAFPEAPRYPFPLVTLTSERSRDGIVRLLKSNADALSANHFGKFNAAVRAATEGADMWAMT